MLKVNKWKEKDSRCLNNKNSNKRKVKKKMSLTLITQTTLQPRVLKEFK